MTSGPLDEIDLVAGGQRHHGLLPVRAPALEAAHALELALVGRGADGRHLDVEHALHRGADLHLVGVGPHLEGHGVELFLLPHALLGHERADQHLTRVATHDERASSIAFRAARSNTTWRACSSW